MFREGWSSDPMSGLCWLGDAGGIVYTWCKNAKPLHVLIDET